MKSNSNVTRLSIKDAKKLLAATESHLRSFCVGTPAPGDELARNVRKAAQQEKTLAAVAPFLTLYVTLLEAVSALSPLGRSKRFHLIAID